MLVIADFERVIRMLLRVLQILLRQPGIVLCLERVDSSLEFGMPVEELIRHVPDESELLYLIPYLLQLLLQSGNELRPDCWTLFIRIQAQTTVDALRNSSGVCPPSRIWRRLVFQWMM